MSLTFTVAVSPLASDTAPSTLFPKRSTSPFLFPNHFLQQPLLPCRRRLLLSLPRARNRGPRTAPLFRQECSSPRQLPFKCTAQLRLVSVAVRSLTAALRWTHSHPPPHCRRRPPCGTCTAPPCPSRQLPLKEFQYYPYTPEGGHPPPRYPKSPTPAYPDLQE